MQGAEILPVIYVSLSRRIPEELEHWIQDFCSDRRASIEVYGGKTKEQEIALLWLPQGSLFRRGSEKSK